MQKKKEREKAKQWCYKNRGGVRLNILPGPSSVEEGDGRWGMSKDEKEKRLVLSSREWAALSQSLPLAHLHVCQMQDYVFSKMNMQQLSNFHSAHPLKCNVGKINASSFSNQQHTAACFVFFLV